MNETLGFGYSITFRDMFSKVADKVENKFKTMATRMDISSDKINSNFKRLSAGLKTAGVGLALSILPAIFAKQIFAVEESQAELASLGIKNLKSIREIAWQTSSEIAGVTSDSFIRAAYDIKSGISSLSDEAVGGMTKTAARVAKATKASTETMTSLFATGYGIFKGLDNQMNDLDWGEKFGAGISKAVQLFKTNGSDMEAAVKNSGKSATLLNYSLEEQLALLGSLQTTLKGAEAGTTVRSLFNKMAQAQKVLGMSFKDSFGQFKTLPDIIDQIKQKYGDTYTDIIGMKLDSAFTEEGAKAIKLMWDQTDNLRDSIKQLNSATADSTGTIDGMVSAMQKGNISASWTIAAQRFKVAIEQLGYIVKPIFLPIINTISSMVKKLQEFIKNHPQVMGAILKTISVVGLFITAIGAGATALSIFGLMGPAVKIGFNMLIGALQKLGIVGKMVGALLNASLWQIILIVGLVALAGYGLYKAWSTNFGGIRELIVNWYNNVKLIFDSLYELISTTSGGVGTLSGELADALTGAGLLDTVISIYMVFYRLYNFVMGIGSGFKQAFSGIGESFKPLFSELSKLTDVLMPIFNLIYDSFMKLIGGVNGADTSGFSRFGEIVGYIFGSVILTSIKLVVSAITTIVVVIRNVMSAVISIITWAWNIIAGVFNIGWSIIKGIWDFWANLLVGDFAGAFESLKTMISGIWEGIGQIFEGLGQLFFDAGASLINALIEGIASLAGGVWDAISGTLSGATEWFSKLLDSDENVGELETTSNINQTTSGLGTSNILSPPSNMLSQADSNEPDYTNQLAAKNTAPTVNVGSPTVNVPQQKQEIHMRVDLDGREVHKSVKEYDELEGARS